MNHPSSSIDFQLPIPCFFWMISESPGGRFLSVFYLPLKRTTSKFTTENQVDWKMIHVVFLGGIFRGELLVSESVYIYIYNTSKQ